MPCEKDFFFQLPPRAPPPDAIFPFPSEPHLVKDIPAIAADVLRKKQKTLALSALDKMAEYGWPGNIRQLLNCVARAALNSQKDKIAPDDIVFQGNPAGSLWDEARSGRPGGGTASA